MTSNFFINKSKSFYSNSFYLYLDQQQYVKSYKFISRTKKQFNQIFNMLEKKPPIVTRETDSIDDVLNNVFYFYRIHANVITRIIMDLSGRDLVESHELQGRKRTYRLTKRGELARQVLDTRTR